MALQKAQQEGQQRIAPGQACHPNRRAPPKPESQCRSALAIKYSLYTIGYILYLDFESLLAHDSRAVPNCRQ